MPKPGEVYEADCSSKTEIAFVIVLAMSGIDEAWLRFNTTDRRFECLTPSELGVKIADDIEDVLATRKVSA